jgi:hypothetical protein
LDGEKGPMDFYRYLTSQTGRKDFVGEFARLIVRPGRTLSRNYGYYEWINKLTYHQADEEAMLAFNTAWREFRKKIIPYTLFKQKQAEKAEVEAECYDYATAE